MYAYRENTVRKESYYAPVRHAVTNPVHKKKVRVKKKNPIRDFFRQIIVLCALSLFAVFIFPKAYNDLFKQIYFTDGLNIYETYNLQSWNKLPGVNIYGVMYPVTDYIYNDIYNNYQLLTPTVQKRQSEITTMYQTSEMASLKKDLLNLINSYKSIDPAIYVWEYEQGKYVDINSNKLYSAASIIKLPILVRLFKSIEANQLTIYDQMKMTEPYRSSGSGNLQYMLAGNEYNMDYLAKTMIQDSDNTSTNMIMSKLGGMDDINIGLRDWGISTTYVRTWLPDLEGTNKTTAADIAKILYNLDNPGFLNVNSREYIIDYMSHVKNNRLIQAGLGEGALFIHKTGDIGTMLGDAGIVFAPNGRKYIVVILVNRPYNSPLGKDFIVKASSLIYNAVVN